MNECSVKAWLTKLVSTPNVCFASITNETLGYHRTLINESANTGGKNESNAGERDSYDVRGKGVHSNCLQLSLSFQLAWPVGM